MAYGIVLFNGPCQIWIDLAQFCKYGGLFGKFSNLSVSLAKVVKLRANFRLFLKLIHNKLIRKTIELQVDDTSDVGIYSIL